ncbi:MAG: ribosome silencing factor [Armatimonadetes bacterium]|nr:ribosome silencing factor [Armatimonadota bacterium]MBS1725936.1 ribosome silencing factor [Armatimonadota bacterium]
MTSAEKVDLIRDAADDMKAERIEILDVRKKTSISDYFVVCSGTSDRHVDSIADRVAEKMATLKVKPLRTEGERSGWILQDYGDVVLHVMKEEQRQFYDLEALWESVQNNPDLEL